MSELQEGTVASETQCPDKGAHSFQHSTHQAETRTTANLGPLALEHDMLSSGKIPTSPWHYMEEPHVHALLPLNEGDGFRLHPGQSTCTTGPISRSTFINMYRSVTGT